MNNSSDFVVNIRCKGRKLWAGLLEAGESGETRTFKPDLSSGIAPEKPAVVEYVGSAAETSTSSGRLLVESASERVQYWVDSLGP